jgi:hypothetical protein
MHGELLGIPLGTNDDGNHAIHHKLALKRCSYISHADLGDNVWPGIEVVEW